MTTDIEKRPAESPLPKVVTFKSGVEEVQLTIGMVGDMLVKPTRTGKKPTKADIVKFIMLCKSQKLNPWVGDAFLVGYDSQGGAEFSLISSHASLLKRADVQESYKGMASGIIVKADDKVEEKEGKFRLDGEILLGAWAEVSVEGKKFGRKKVRLQAFDKDNKFWKRDKEGMIVKCAEASALREAFPNVLSGSYIREEMSQAIDVTSEVEVTGPNVVSSSLAEPTVGSGQPVTKPEPEKTRSEKAAETRAKNKAAKEAEKGEPVIPPQATQEPQEQEPQQEPGAEVKEGGPFALPVQNEGNGLSEPE